MISYHLTIPAIPDEPPISQSERALQAARRYCPRGWIALPDTIRVREIAHPLLWMVLSVTVSAVPVVQGEDFDAWEREMA